MLYAAREQVESAPITLGMDTDLGGEATYEVGENQYVGSAQGMMGNVVTRVTVQELARDDKSAAVSGISAGDFIITTSNKPVEAGKQVRLADNG